MSRTIPTSSPSLCAVWTKTARRNGNPSSPVPSAATSGFPVRLTPHLTCTSAQDRQSREPRPMAFRHRRQSQRDCRGSGSVRGYLVWRIHLSARPRHFGHRFRSYLYKTGGSCTQVTRTLDPGATPRPLLRDPVRARASLYRTCRRSMTFPCPHRTHFVGRCALR